MPIFNVIIEATAAVTITLAVEADNEIEAEELIGAKLENRGSALTESINDAVNGLLDVTGLALEGFNEEAEPEYPFMRLSLELDESGFEVVTAEESDEEE